MPIIWVLDEDEDKPLTDDGVVEVFLQQPFTARELLIQVRKLLPRQRMAGVLSVNGFVFDVERRKVYKDTACRQLTPRQAKLLEAFMRQPDETLSRRFLMKHVWNTDYLGDTRTLDVHIRWVREAIEDNPSKPKYLRTVRRVGYRFETGNVAA